MKKTVLTALLFALTFGIAGASSVNGDFDGNPVVKVQAGGQELQVEDVPATIYKGRTVVPIYLLKQLGAEVSWNADAYTVNVTMPSSAATKPDPAAEERQLLKGAYEWLKDTDTAMSLYLDELQRFGALDNGATYKPMLDEDYNKLITLYNDAFQMVHGLEGRVQKPSDLLSVTISESKTLEQIGKAKSALYDMFEVSDNPAVAKSYRLNMALATRSAQQNLVHTTELLHKLQP